MWSSKIKSRSAMKISVRATLNRLMGEGLDRHEAIRAIGLVLSEYIYDLAPAREPETTGSRAITRLWSASPPIIGAARGDRAVAASSQRPATPLVSKSLAYIGFLRYCQYRKNATIAYHLM